MKFNNIRLLVKDFDQCFRFYNDILGLTCTWGKPGENFASFDIGIPSALCLFRADLMDAAIGQSETRQNENLPDKMAIVLEVDNIDHTYALLEKKGIHFVTKPKDMVVWGIRVAHFRDPENNLIELFSGLQG